MFLCGEATIIGIGEKRVNRVVTRQEAIEADSIVGRRGPSRTPERRAA
jgi:hypothetical protein